MRPWRFASFGRRSDEEVEACDAFLGRPGAKSENRAGMSDAVAAAANRIPQF